MPDSFDDLKINYVEKTSIREWWVEVSIISALCAVVPLILIIWHFKRKCRKSSASNGNKKGQSSEK